MKVYAVIERCEDYYYPDYRVVDDCVYLKEEDAKKRMEELVKKNLGLFPEQFGILDFEVKDSEGFYGEAIYLAV